MHAHAPEEWPTQTKARKYRLPYRRLQRNGLPRDLDPSRWHAPTPRWRLRSLANESSTSLIRDHVSAMRLLHTQLNYALRHMYVYTNTAELLSSCSEEQIGLSCMMGCKPCVSTRGVSSPDSPVSCLPSMRAIYLSTLVVFAIGTNSIPPPASSSNHVISQSAWLPSKSTLSRRRSKQR